MDRQSDEGTRTRLLWTLAAACVLAVGGALVAQYQFDMRPCPWCVLQRGIYLLMAVAFGTAALLGRRRPSSLLPIGLGLALSIAGGASAIYQHVVAAQQFSCARTLADRIIAALRLDESLPSVFSATATCAEAAVSVVGVPFAYWSLLMFTLLGAGSVWALRPLRHRS